MRRHYMVKDYYLQEYRKVILSIAQNIYRLLKTLSLYIKALLVKWYNSM